MLCDLLNLRPTAMPKPAWQADWRFWGLNYDQFQSLLLAVLILSIIIVPQWLFSLVKVPEGGPPKRAHAAGNPFTKKRAVHTKGE